MILHNFAQFLQRKFSPFVPELAALGPVFKPAQKEARFMCGRGGGAIPRFGVAQGVRLHQQKRAERIQEIRI